MSVRRVYHLLLRPAIEIVFSASVALPIYSTTLHVPGYSMGKVASSQEIKERDGRSLKDPSAGCLRNM